MPYLKEAVEKKRQYYIESLLDIGIYKKKQIVDQSTLYIGLGVDAHEGFY